MGKNEGQPYHLDRIHLPVREGFEGHDSRLVKIVQQYNGVTAVMQSAIMLFAPSEVRNNNVLKRETILPRRRSVKITRQQKRAAFIIGFVLASIFTHPIVPAFCAMGLLIAKFVFQGDKGEWPESTLAFPYHRDPHIGQLGLPAPNQSSEG